MCIFKPPGGSAHPVSKLHGQWAEWVEELTPVSGAPGVWTEAPTRRSLRGKLVSRHCRVLTYPSVSLLDRGAVEQILVLVFPALPPPPLDPVRSLVWLVLFKHQGCRKCSTKKIRMILYHRRVRGEE